MTLSLRTATAGDLPAMLEIDERAFGFHYSPEAREDAAPTLDPDRFLLAHDGPQLVGVTGAYAFDVTPPGGKPVASEGVTWVGVLGTHRRRGVLRALFAEQHRAFVSAGVPFSVLTASEGGIYGRFGYAPAVADPSVEIDRRRAVFRADAPDPGGVRYAGAEEFAALAPDLHARWCAGTPGAVSRTPVWWRRHLLDREYDRRGASGMFHLVHADGFASYRVTGETCRIVDLFAVTLDAHVALWRVLLALDLVQTITTRAVTADDPLPFLLTDPRQVRTVGNPDGMWIRVLDVPAALAARRYGAEVDAVLEVRDTSLGSPAQGRFRLQGGPDGAGCAATEDAAEVHLDVTALGALYFGGVRLRTLVDAGLARVDDEALLRRMDAVWAADRLPRYGTGF